MTPVIIVGAGPVGMTAALLLARAGVPSVILEAAEERTAEGSRSICVQRDVLNILERVGVGRAVAAAGITWYRGRTFHRQREVLTTELPRSPTDDFPPFVNTPQTVVERLLEERVRASPLIDLRYGSTVTAVTQDKAGVHVSTVDDTFDGTHCVAADGAHSTVRKLLGITFDGHSFTDRFLIADIKVDLPNDPPERHFHFDPPWNPGRQVLLHPQPDGIWRIDWQVPKDTNLTADHIMAVVGDRDYEVVWHSTYNFHQRRASTLHTGRILLAGDAAHVMSPFGARGLNSGICDADNATWKIALAHTNEAGPNLLASYNHERGAAADENLRITNATMRFLVPNTPTEHATRTKALTTGKNIDSGTLFTPHAYNDSPLTTPDCNGALQENSHWCGPHFTALPNGTLIRPDGHHAAHKATPAAHRRATGWP